MPLKAKLYIETELRGGRTILKRSFAGQPFKLADITEDKSGNYLQLMLMNSSPGILDGDEYECEVIVGERSSVHLQSQSYQRLFTMKSGAAQVFNVHLDVSSSLVFLPHPIVPHKNSCFRSVSNIHLEPGCTLVWGEIMSCGRAENGEVFHFTSYHNTTKVFLNKKLVVKENILLQPKSIDLLSIGQLEGFTHQATLIYISDKIVFEEMANTILERLGSEKNIEFGFSKLPVNGMVVRILGYKAEQLFSLLKAVADIINPVHQKIKTPHLNVA